MSTSARGLAKVALQLTFSFFDDSLRPPPPQHTPVTDQEQVEGEIRSNEQGLKRALKDLNDKGGVPKSVGKGLLNAFVNLEDNKNMTKKREIDSNSDDDDKE